jgi:hypothetical protein
VQNQNDAMPRSANGEPAATGSDATPDLPAGKRSGVPHNTRPANDTPSNPSDEVSHQIVGPSDRAPDAGRSGNAADKRVPVHGEATRDTEEANAYASGLDQGEAQHARDTTLMPPPPYPKRPDGE